MTPASAKVILQRLAFAVVGLLIAYLSGWGHASGEVIEGILVGSFVAYGICLFPAGATRRRQTRHQ